MKKITILFLAVFFTLNLTALLAYENAGPEYTQTLAIKGTASRIQAFEAYIKKYPDVEQNMFTKFAYYWLAFDYYTVKNYGNAIKNGNKFLEYKDVDKNLEAKTYLILASSYGVKDTPGYSKEKANSFADKAISLSKASGFNDIVSSAEKLKRALAGAEKKPLTPLQKLGVAYQNGNYEEVISLFKSLPEKDQENDDIFRVYAQALLNAKKIDIAIREFSDKYSKSATAVNASRLAQIYLSKSEKDKSYTDRAISTLIEASLLFNKEKNSKNAKLMMDNARYQYYEKYQFNRKIAAYNAKLQEEDKKNQSNKNLQTDIARLEKEYAKVEADIQRRYGDIEAPAYEYDKLDKIRKQIADLKSGKGGSGGKSAELEKEGKALDEERKKIDSEFQKLVDAAKKKLGL